MLGLLGLVQLVVLYSWWTLSNADNEIARLGGSLLHPRQTFNVPESTAFSDNDNIMAALACWLLVDHQSPPHRGLLDSANFQ